MDAVTNLFGLESASIVGTLTLTKSGSTARTATFPDLTGTVAISGASQSVSFSSLTIDGTAAGSITTAGGVTATSGLYVNGTSGAIKSFCQIQRGGVTAWFMSVRDATDDLRFSAYDDAGVAIDYPLTIARAAGGAITLTRPLTATSIAMSGALTGVTTITASGAISTTSATASTSTTTGALVVSGGAGFGGNVNIGGDIARGSGASAWELSARAAVTTIPAVVLRPKQANLTCAFDVMPNGSPTEDGNSGWAWIDVVDTDVKAGNPAMTTAHVGNTTGGVVFGSKNYNGASAKPVIFKIGATEVGRWNTTGGLTIPQVAGVSQVRAGSINIQCLTATNNSWFSENAVFDGISTKYIANGRASGMRFDDGSGKFVVWTATSGLAGAAVTLNNRLEIDGATGAATFAAGITCTTLTVNAADYTYWGPSGTDGTWRMGRSGSDFVIQRRESGSYVTKQTIAA